MMEYSMNRDRSRRKLAAFSCMMALALVLFSGQELKGSTAPEAEPNILLFLSLDRCIRTPSLL